MASYLLFFKLSWVQYSVDRDDFSSWFLKLSFIGHCKFILSSSQKSRLWILETCTKLYFLSLPLRMYTLRHAFSSRSVLSAVHVLTDLKCIWWSNDYPRDYRSSMYISPCIYIRCLTLPRVKDEPFHEWIHIVLLSFLVILSYFLHNAV